MAIKILAALALGMSVLGCPVDPQTLAPDAELGLSDAGQPDGALRFDATPGELGPMDAGGEVVLERVTPDNGVVTGGYRVRLSGQGFTADMTVRFGEVPADQLLLQNSRSVTVRVPAGLASGPVAVTVANAAHSSTVEGAFTYFDALAIDSVNPELISTVGGDRVTLHGAGLSANLLVLCGGRAASEVELLDDGTLRFTAPPGAAGLANVELLGVYGHAEAPLVVRYLEPVRVQRVEPPHIPTSGSSTLLIYGEGFTELSQVVVGQQSVSEVELIDAERLQVRLDPRPETGALDVEVRDPLSSAILAGGLWVGDTSGSGFALRGLAPTEGSIAGGDRVALVGQGFDQSLQVRFDGQLASVDEVASPSLVFVQSPAHAAGLVDVSASQGGDTQTLSAAYRYAAQPVLSQVEPGTGPASGGTAITLLGANFASGTQVFVGGQAASEVVRVNDGQLTARTPPGSAGAVDVELLSGGHRTRLVEGFVYQQALQATAVRPVRGGMAGGTYTLIYGAGFASGATPHVRFGDVEARDLVVRSDNLISLRTPAQAPGLVDVSVQRGDTQVVLARAFTFYDPGSILGGTGGGTVDGAIYVSCYHAITGMPLEGITVQLGVNADTPYVTLTDAFGQATLSGPDLHGPQTVTAAADGYESVTLIEADAREISLFLSPTTMSSGSGSPPPQPPPPIISGRVYGFAKELFDPAALGPGESAMAIVQTTMRSIFSQPQQPAQSQYVVANGGSYTIGAARPGRLAVVAVAGIYNVATQSFRPRQIGFHRGVQAGYGDVLEDIDVELTVPLNTELVVTLPEMPYGDPDPESGLVMPFVNLGGEGVYLLSQEIVGGARSITFGDFPDLPGEMLTFLAGAFVVDPSRPCQQSGSCRYSVVVRDGVGDLSSGISLDPVLGFPELIEPSRNGVMQGNRMRWKPAPGTLPSYYEIYISGFDGTAWDFYVPGHLRKLLLPRLADLGSDAPPHDAGLGAYQGWMIAVYVPGFDFDSFSYIDLSGPARRSWTQDSFKFVNANTP